jgi:hypothetical protein
MDDTPSESNEPPAETSGILGHSYHGHSYHGPVLGNHSNNMGQKQAELEVHPSLAEDL